MQLHELHPSLIHLPLGLLPLAAGLDLAAALSGRALERLLDQAEITRLADVRSLDALARAHPGHRGARKLHNALHRHTAGTTLTRSDLEERFLALCDGAGIDRPRVNAHVEGLEVDFAWPRHRLVVETDGWEYHRTRAAFENDRRRDAALARAGWRTLRFTHRQIAGAPNEVAETLRAGTAGTAPHPGGSR
jgi:hypothetical protein